MTPREGLDPAMARRGRVLGSLEGSLGPGPDASLWSASRPGPGAWPPLAACGQSGWRIGASSERERASMRCCKRASMLVPRIDADLLPKPKIRSAARCGGKSCGFLYEKSTGFIHDKSSGFLIRNPPDFYKKARHPVRHSGTYKKARRAARGASQFI